MKNIRIETGGGEKLFPQIILDNTNNEIYIFGKMTGITEVKFLTTIPIEQYVGIRPNFTSIAGLSPVSIQINGIVCRWNSNSLSYKPETPIRLSGDTFTFNILNTMNIFDINIGRGTTFENNAFKVTSDTIIMSVTHCFAPEWDGKQEIYTIKINS